MATATEPLFAPQNIATAPGTSKLILEHIHNSYGFIPNLLAIFANSPTVLQGQGSRNPFGERITITNWLINLLNKTRLLEGDIDNHLVARASLRHAT